MRIVLMAVSMLLSGFVQAQPVSAWADKLCSAASQDSAFGVLVDGLIESGKVSLQAGEALLSQPCGGQQTVLSRMVNQRQAENLEYAVIDLGLNLKTAHVELQGQQMLLGDALVRLGQQGDSQTQAFVSDYLDSLEDKDFNPNLRVSLK
ncbi:MAG: hypothetical protein R3292_06080 [Alcanivorax sp.]|nr:hypothetical protein [Alcanivorax sp.]